VSGPATSPRDEKGSSKAVFGARCNTNAECATGHFCLDSDYSPFKWCTRLCSMSDAGNHCDQAALSDANGFCILMPPGSRGPGQPFCVPECGKFAQCTGLDPDWESCEKAAYKKIVLYPDRNQDVCMAASANGQPVVDPLTCNWKDKVTDPKFDQAKGTCAAYCLFKTTCKLFDPTVENADCCTWHCFQRLTPGNVVDNTAVSRVKCFINAFNGSQGSPDVCSSWQDQCQDKWGSPP